jgi:hypothetical protein
MSKRSHHHQCHHRMDGWMDGWTHACNGKRIMLHHRKRLCTLTILLFLPCFIVHFNSHLYQPHSTKNASTFLSSWPLIPQTKFLFHIVARCLDAFCSEPNLWQAFFFFFFFFFFLLLLFLEINIGLIRTAGSYQLGLHWNLIL